MTEEERSNIAEESRIPLQERFEEEVKAETKYRDPLIHPQKLDLLAGWKFANYVKTN